MIKILKFELIGHIYGEYNVGLLITRVVNNLVILTKLLSKMASLRFYRIFFDRFMVSLSYLISQRLPAHTIDVRKQS